MSDKQKQLDADIRFAHHKTQMLGAMFPVDAPERHPVIHLRLMDIADSLANLVSAPMEVSHYNSLIAHCKTAVELLEYLKTGKVPVQDALNESSTAASEQSKDATVDRKLFNEVSERYLDKHPGTLYNPEELRAHIEAAVRDL